MTCQTNTVTLIQNRAEQRQKMAEADLEKLQADEAAASLGWELNQSQQTSQRLLVALTQLVRSSCELVQVLESSYKQLTEYEYALLDATSASDVQLPNEITEGAINAIKHRKRVIEIFRKGLEIDYSELIR